MDPPKNSSTEDEEVVTFPKAAHPPSPRAAPPSPRAAPPSPRAASPSPQTSPRHSPPGEGAGADYSEFNSEDESSDDELDEISRFFTSQSQKAFDSPESPQSSESLNNDLHVSERDYVAQLVSEDGLQGLSIGRFEGWLGKDCLLQGKIFITKRYFLFYAHLPQPTLETLKASPLGKKSARGFQSLKKTVYRRYWFVLRMGSFAWYNDPADIYFPTGIISLNLMAAVRQDKDSPEKFMLQGLDGKTYVFKADSRNASHEWVKAIQKEIFRARNDNARPAAVVRIPLENIFHVSCVTPLDIVDVVNFQVVMSPSDPDRPNLPKTGSYSFAFFGEKSTSKVIANRIASATNDFEHHRGVTYENTDTPIREVDFNTSKFGPTTEQVYDTTPPSEFHLFEDRRFTDDSEIPTNSGDSIMIMNTQEASESCSTIQSSPGTSPSHHLSPTTTRGGQSHTPTRSLSRTGSRLQSLIPTRSVTRSATPTDSYSHSKSKLNILATLNEKLHKLKTDEMFRPDINAIASAAAVPIKLVPFTDSSSAQTSDKEDDESDYESDGEDGEDGEEDKHPSNDSSRSSSFLDDKFLPFIPQNFTKKILFGSNSAPAPIREESESIYCDTVDGEEDLDALNKWFREHFGLEPGVTLLAEYICSLKKPGDSSSWSGKLLVANMFLCFQRRNVSGGNWRMVIPLRDIIHVHEQPPSSTRMEFEVAETAYGNFRLTFSEAAGRRDAEGMLKYVIKNLAQNDPDLKLDRTLEQQNLDSDSETRFIEYGLRSARLSTYEPTLTTQLRHRIPPLIFDPTSTQYKEIFLQKPMKTLKFMMLMIGSRGDVQPYVALCQGLMEEGHECCIVTHKEFKDWVESFGIEFREVAGDPRKLMEIMISHGSISYGFVRDALHYFKGWLKELMHTSWKAMRDSNADVLIESPSSMIGIHIAEALEIPYFRAFTMPWTRTKAYPQALIASDQRHGGSYNSFTYLMYDRLVWFGISKYVNRWRKKHLGLPETDLDTLRQEDVPFLYCVSPTVLVPPLDQPDWVHTCGYWELRQDKKSKNPDVDPKLVEFIKKSREMKKPVVYIGFGSIIVTDPEAMTRTIVDSTKNAKVNCILARGWSGRSTKSKESERKEKKPLNYEHIFEVESVPHQWLFPQMDVCVHHGGSGTTGASLRSGKPTIIKPFFGDQFFYGRRVEDLGVGCCLKKLTTSGLTSALEECVSNKQMIRQARVLGEQIRHEHGVEEAILCIYRELAYAEDVTTRRKKATVDNSKSFTDKIQLLHPGDIWLHSEKKTKDMLELSDDKSHSWFSLPKFGRREEQRQNQNANEEVDVSV